MRVLDLFGTFSESGSVERHWKGVGFVSPTLSMVITPISLKVANRCVGNKEDIETD
jgi:hypothetical protein